ncbi:hypothetical protein KC19_9G140000 [Ceratodon purpureus]|uniref:Glycoside hydrolase family 31 N-terminal domain-containing protein n=1 Tax=Ceratodon purpureus TaxID=3225 RepID=A0A8T0GRR9_CERPU|nr:hypothetical protein KC19_9G140000 [Ceratodon purpureus]
MSILGESVFQFVESDVARQHAMPCLSFENPKLREERVDTSNFERKAPVFVPKFQIYGDQQEVVFQLPSGSSFYGTGEAGGPMERTDKRIYTWNTDAWGYNQNTTSLYQDSVFSVLPNREPFGVLADTC